MDRLAVPVAFIIVIGLVAVLVGAPLVPGLKVPGAASLGSAAGTIPDALDALVAPTTVQDVDLSTLLAARGGQAQVGLPQGLVGRWAGGMEVYVPAAVHLPAYPALQGPERALTSVEVDHPATAAKSDTAGGTDSSAAGGSVHYQGD